MKKIEYIFVNETDSESAAYAIRRSHVSDLRHHIIVNGTGLDFSEGDEHKALLCKLCRLRRHYPKAKILGVSEVNTSSTYAPISVNPAMNALRREMSDLP